MVSETDLLARLKEAAAGSNMVFLHIHPLLPIPRLQGSNPLVRKRLALFQTACPIRGNTVGHGTLGGQEWTENGDG
jgi:hypothetical protein